MFPCTKTRFGTNQGGVNTVNTLAEVAQTMQLGKAMKDPERFLARQIKAGRIRARKVGRAWMMTDADVSYALDQFANTIVDSPAPAVTVAGAPSAASMRRRRRVA